MDGTISQFTRSLSSQFEKQIASTLNIAHLRAGKHIARDHRDWKIGEYEFDSVWLATIIPSFHPPGAIAVLSNKTNTFGVLAVSNDPKNISQTTSLISAEFTAGWLDPVSKILNHANLFDLGGGISLDGIGYRLIINTLACTTELYFSNPQTKQFIELESALFKVGQEITKISKDQIASDFLDMWQGYAKHSEQ